MRLSTLGHTLFAFIFALTTSLACAQVTAHYEAPANAREQAIHDLVRQDGVVDSAATLINDLLRLPRPMRIIIGGADGPLFDPEHFEIIIPYAFIDEARQRFAAVSDTPTDALADQASLDALAHTVFHEIGHALIAMVDLPVVGREEDAADALATVLLLEYFEQGHEMALNAADLFDLESQDRGALQTGDFWDEHSLDEQRFFSINCHVYGSEPRKFTDLPASIDMPPERADACIDEYEQAASGWLRLLEPYLRESDDAPRQ